MEFRSLLKKSEEIVFTDHNSQNWLKDKYLYGGGNPRYFTFQLALNLLGSRTDSPLIVETGCQRLPNDIGDGMSTSIWGEYCKRYGGKVYAIDLSPESIEECKKATVQYKDHIRYIISDSVKWLHNSRIGAIDLLYLDSFDYPYGEILKRYGWPANPEEAIKRSNEASFQEILTNNKPDIDPCQDHCLSEFKAAKKSGKLKDSTIILLDDNQLPGGGKPFKLKRELLKEGWICLLDYQQSLWIQKV